MSARYLSSPLGSLTDSYIYDAFGSLLHATGSTVNNYLYTGEQYDPNVGFYYLRARYFDQSIGRFTTHDPLLGNPFEPVSLHRYVYGNANPISFVDPSGQRSTSLVAIGVMIAITNIMATIALHSRVKLAKDISSRWGPEWDMEWDGTLIYGGLGELVFGFRGIGLLVKTQECFDGRIGIEHRYIVAAFGFSIPIPVIPLPVAGGICDFKATGYAGNSSATFEGLMTFFTLGYAFLPGTGGERALARDVGASRDRAFRANQVGGMWWEYAESLGRFSCLGLDFSQEWMTGVSLALFPYKNSGQPCAR
jgi:RHS repeat-associated protein